MTDEQKETALDAFRNYTSPNKSSLEEIVEVFNGEFGEENVDAVVPTEEDIIICIEDVLERIPDFSISGIQDKVKSYLDRRYDNILIIHVHFPVVKITNEEDRFTIIKDLYAEIEVHQGRLYNNFRLQRTTFSKEHWDCGYAHSHLPNKLGWQNPCLGTGPIASTQYRLKENGNIELWGLFAYELGKYVTVESLSGVPYKRLESIGSMGSRVSPPGNTELNINFFFVDSSRVMICQFIKEWVKTNSLKVGYSNGQYNLGEDIFMVWLKLSRDFISWFNRNADENSPSLDDLQRTGVLIKSIIAGRNVYLWDKRNRNTDSDIPTDPVFKFKGEQIYIKVEDNDNNVEENVCYLLNGRIINFLLTKFYECANYRKWGKRDEEGGEKENSSINKEYRIF